MLTCEAFPCLVVVNALLRLSALRRKGARIARGCWIKSRFAIGTGSSLGAACVIRGAGAISIGNYCAIGEAVRFITSNHDTDRLSMNYYVQDALAGARFTAPKRGITIGHDVWIGDAAIVLPGVTIGNGAVVGAGAVVTRDVEAFSIVAGNPAREIRKRFAPDVARRIEALAWWNWDAGRLARNAHLFALKCSEQAAQFEHPLP
jgi:acetyltransferase-like isoleucine patch superfamily enzyme